MQLEIGRIFDDFPRNERKLGKRENSLMRSFSNLPSSGLTIGDLLTEEKMELIYV